MTKEEYQQAQQTLKVLESLLPRYSVTTIETIIKGIKARIKYYEEINKK
jgi:hypothetical protein